MALRNLREYYDEIGNNRGILLSTLLILIGILFIVLGVMEKNKSFDCDYPNKICKTDNVNVCICCPTNCKDPIGSCYYIYDNSNKVEFFIIGGIFLFMGTLLCWINIRDWNTE